MRVDVEGLRMEIVLSQPAPPPQDDLSLRWSPAVGTGSQESGLPRAGKHSMERDGIFPIQASLDGCTSPEQGMLLQADVGVDDEEATTINAQAAAREEFARPPKNRRQQRVTA